MRVTLTNIYNDTTYPDSDFIGDHGQSFYISSKTHKVLFDTGDKGDILLHNLNLLSINPDDIQIIVLSHGHYDHTGGLPFLLKRRSSNIPLQIIAHPSVFENKKTPVRKWFLSMKRSIGAPSLSRRLRKQIDITYVKKPFEISPWLYTVGEVNQRKYRDGTEDRIMHKEERRWVQDPLLDDLSVVINTQQGLVLVCGCCHAGLLNTLEQVRLTHPEKKIHAIVGGTHMLWFKKPDMDLIGDLLETEYNMPLLYLNHCTGNYAIDQLRTRFGKNLVKSCRPGTQLTFDI